MSLDDADLSADDADQPAGRRFHVGAHGFDAPALPPALHVVATPIGNLRDVTLRALEVLAAADVVLCEDTRQSRVLLNRYAIRATLWPYHEHNAALQRPKVLQALAAGRSVALISDAGTPLISDPGYKLVEAVVEAGFKIVPLPGPSALLAALVVSGLPSDTFLFAGFLPARTEARRQRIEALTPVPATLLIYESPHRIAETLAEMAAIMGAERPAAVARELTKTFEEVTRAPLGELARRFADRTVKGEIVLVVGPPAEAPTDDVDVDRLLAAALEHAPPGKAAAEIARLTGQDRKALYERALAMKGAKPAKPKG